MKDLNSKEEFDNFIQNSPEGETIVVQFWADWCKVSKSLTRSLNSLPNNLSDKVGRVDITEDSTFSICEKYNIVYTPTLIYFKNGEEIDRSIGFLGSSPIIKRLKNEKGRDIS